MTFSICVREPVIVDDEDHWKFGVAVTTRLPGVGVLCPFVSKHGAIATQASVNTELGRKGIEYLQDGLTVSDALPALLDTDDEARRRQLHGVCRDETYAYSGDGCSDWFGDVVGENHTVAGNLLAGANVVDATANQYAQSERGTPLAGRLIEALAAGYEKGGDKREELVEQSAAVMVATTVQPPEDGRWYHHNLRVDATEDPIEDLRQTYDLALNRSAPPISSL